VAGAANQRFLPAFQLPSTTDMGCQVVTVILTYIVKGKENSIRPKMKSGC
jgi:hypothetical protein